MKKYQIGIIDDNHKIAQQLQQKLSLVDDVEILFFEDRGLKGINWLNTNLQKPNIILMDIEMPDMDGIETTFRIKQIFPGIQIIMLTVFESEDSIFNAIKAGATGYLLKDEKLESILNSFEEVLSGGAPMSPLIAQKTIQMLSKGYKPQQVVIYANNSEEQLSKRELEILQLLANGLRNFEVAERLFISNATVKKHIENIYNKLQIHSRAELVNWYHINK
ncbi:MAG: response regulator transcription factor [Bacteroidia bacterium]|nr:response regulator transcription factor [Bacteroidia bacterium]